MKPYHDKINQIENTYNQKIANKIGLPIQADTPLGSGAFGTVFPVKGKSNLVVKLGRPLEFETPETMYHLQQVGKELKDPNIALPIKTTFFEGQRGTNMSQIMPFVEGKPVRNPINVPQSSMDDLVSKIKNLHDKGVLVDFVNPDNILFDAAKNKFSIVDLNTQAPEYHFFNQVNKPKIG